MGNAEGKPLLLALSVHTPPTMVISVVKAVKALSVVTARMVAETIVTATVVAVWFLLRLDQPRFWCARLHRSGRRTVTDDMSCRWAETRPIVPGDSTIRLMADAPRYTTSNQQDAQRTTSDQVAACSMLDVHTAVEKVVQGFVGQLHSDIRVRNLETSNRTLRDSSSRAMLAVPSDLVGGSLVQGRSEWKDKTFGTMEHFCCRELDLGIGVVGLHQPCGNTSLHVHCCGCCYLWCCCCGCIDRQVQHYV